MLPGDIDPSDMVQIATEEVFPELAMEADQNQSLSEFNPKPNVAVSIEEYESWCWPWINTLIVEPVEKRIGLRYMTTKLQQKWAKHGSIHVLDMHDGFFMGCFSDEGDYKHTLFEGSWMVLDHYLMVQH